jgi:cob(I)alamin adenosyltransferase
LLFTGDGKGKTTAALGMALRNTGHGHKTMIIQFIKSDLTGEHEAIETIKNVEIKQVGLGFVPSPESKNFELHKDAAQKGLELVHDKISCGKYDMLILDEICGAVALGLLDDEKVFAALSNAPCEITVVLTGRDATQKLIDLADTVTEMKCVKHGFENGINAQKGVEI